MLSLRQNYLNPTYLQRCSCRIHDSVIIDVINKNTAHQLKLSEIASRTAVVYIMSY